MKEFFLILKDVLSGAVWPLITTAIFIRMSSRSQK